MQHQDLNETNEFPVFSRGPWVYPLSLKCCHYKLGRTCPDASAGRGKKCLERVLSNGEKLLARPLAYRELLDDADADEGRPA